MNVGRAVATTLPAPISGSAGACHRTTIEIVIALVGSSVTAESPVGQVVERTELGRAAAAEIVGGVRQCGAKPIGAAIAGRDGGEIWVELGGLSVISCWWIDAIGSGGQALAGASQVRRLDPWQISFKRKLRVRDREGATGLGAAEQDRSWLGRAPVRPVRLI